VSPFRACRSQTATPGKNITLIVTIAATFIFMFFMSVPPSAVVFGVRQRAIDIGEGLIDVGDCVVERGFCVNWSGLHCRRGRGGPAAGDTADGAGAAVVVATR